MRVYAHMYICTSSAIYQDVKTTHHAMTNMTHTTYMNACVCTSMHPLHLMTMCISVYLFHNMTDK
jgi:hypothetical protein